MLWSLAAEDPSHPARVALALLLCYHADNRAFPTALWSWGLEKYRSREFSEKVIRREMHICNFTAKSNCILCLYFTWQCIVYTNFSGFHWVLLMFFPFPKGAKLLEH